MRGDSLADRMTAPAPYAGLTPETVLDALQVAGLRGDGRLLALNSYENRVYQAWLEDGGSVVAKFYRPGRWSDAQILEEHAFVQELAAREIPAVAPLTLEGRTLTAHAGFRFAVFPRRGGRTPELEDADTLRWLGRYIGRIHAAGAARAFTVPLLSASASRSAATAGRPVSPRSCATITSPRCMPINTIRRPMRSFIAPVGRPAGATWWRPPKPRPFRMVKS